MSNSQTITLLSLAIDNAAESLARWQAHGPGHIEAGWETIVNIDAAMALLISARESLLVNLCREHPARDIRLEFPTHPGRPS